MENNSIGKLKKLLGLGSVLHQETIHPKRDGTKLYHVMGYTLPLRWETIEERGISHDRILEEVDRAQWQKEYHEQREKEAKQQHRIIENNEYNPF